MNPGFWIVHPVLSWNVICFQQAMVSCHMLSELEEVIQYKLVPERREIIRQIWWERLQVRLLKILAPGSPPALPHLLLLSTHCLPPHRGWGGIQGKVLRGCAPQPLAVSE